MALYRNGINRGYLDAGKWWSNITEAPVKLSAVKVACFHGEDGDMINQNGDEVLPSDEVRLRAGV